MRVIRRTAADPGARQPQRGQALVEFALVLIPLALLLLAIAQFGFLLTTQIGLNGTVRDVARWAAAVPTATAAHASSQRTLVYTELTTRLQSNVAMYSFSNLNEPTDSPPSAIRYCSYQDPSGRYSVRVTVDVQYRHPLFYPLLAELVDPLDGTTDGALRVGATESMRVENIPLDSPPAGMTPCS